MHALFYIGALIAIIGGIGTLIAAFRTSFLWGLACFTPAAWAFLFLHWNVAKNPFFLQLVGTVLMLIGVSKSTP